MCWMTYGESNFIQVWYRVTAHVAALPESVRLLRGSLFYFKYATRKQSRTRPVLFL